MVRLSLLHIIEEVLSRLRPLGHIGELFIIDRVGLGLIQDLHFNLVCQTSGIRFRNGLVHVFIHDQVDIAWKILNQVSLLLTDLAVILSVLVNDCESAFELAQIAHAFQGNGEALYFLL